MRPISIRLSMISSAKAYRTSSRAYGRGYKRRRTTCWSRKRFKPKRRAKRDELFFDRYHVREAAIHDRDIALRRSFGIFDSLLYLRGDCLPFGIGWTMDA